MKPQSLFKECASCVHKNDKDNTNETSCVRCCECDNGDMQELNTKKKGG